jgi:TPR repeat protein
MQGDMLAMHELGCMYWYQKGCFMNTPEAIKWFKTAARSGYAESQYFLGQMHQYGTVGHARHLEKAAKYFGMAAQQVPALYGVLVYLYHPYYRAKETFEHSSTGCQCLAAFVWVCA